MALTLVYADGFDDYTTLTQCWPGAGTGTIGAFGRNGSGYRMTASNGTQFLQRDHGVNQSGGTTMFALRTGTITPGNRIGVMQFAGTLALNITTAGKWQVLSGGYNGTSLQISANGPLLSTYQHLEIEWTLNASTGRVKMYVDGNTTPDIDVTGNTGSGTVSTTQFGGVPNNFVTTNVDYDDFVMFDNGGTLNGQIGDQKVETLLPNGNGNSSQWVGSDADSTNNYLLVEEIPPNSDTDYVESGTVGDKDTYSFGNMGAGTGTVRGVQLNLFMKKTDAGLRQIQPVIRHSTTDYNGATRTLPSDYQYFYLPYDTNPGTSAAWTISNVNSDEYGVRVSA